MMVLLLAALFASASAFAQPRVWDFQVDLDGKPIGHHRFVLREEGGTRELTSSARFKVKIVGFTAYHYEHDATEQWNGDCLVRLAASTDDNGERTSVDTAPAGCAMSFAYWNPAILKRTELLNPQSGALEKVAVEKLAAGHYRITGPKHPIELWYSPEGEWLALDSPTDSGRLRYRLERKEAPK